MVKEKRLRLVGEWFSVQLLTIVAGQNCQRKFFLCDGWHFSKKRSKNHQ